MKKKGLEKGLRVISNSIKHVLPKSGFLVILSDNTEDGLEVLTTTNIREEFLLEVLESHADQIRKNIEKKKLSPVVGPVGINKFQF